jgi:hypothetical protein
MFDDPVESEAAKWALFDITSLGSASAQNLFTTFAGAPTRIKQYHKEGRALRTETTIDNTRDFGIGKLLKNLPALRRA